MMQLVTGILQGGKDMGGKNNGFIELFQFHQDLLDNHIAGDIHTVERFVQNENLIFLQQQSGDGQFFLHAG